MSSAFLAAGLALAPALDRWLADGAAFEGCAPETPSGCERYLQRAGPSGRHAARADDLYFASLASSPVDLEGYPRLLPQGRHVAEVPAAVRKAMAAPVQAFAARTARAPEEVRPAVAAWTRALEALRDAGRATVGVRFAAGTGAGRESLLLGMVETALSVDGAPGFRLGAPSPVVVEVEPGAEWTVTVRVEGADPFTLRAPPEALGAKFGL